MTLLSQSSYRTFDPSPYAFPAPKVPVLAKRLATSLALAPSRNYEPITHGTVAEFYSRARYALHEALRRLGVGPGTAVLVPAYHCRNMIDPVLSLGGEVLLYPVTETLDLDTANVDAALAGCRLPVRALLATHFFGFPQELAAIKAWCDARGIALIEDCAHAYFRPRSNSLLGRIGRYAISSPYKFCPSYEGGVLIGLDGERSPALGGRSLKESLSIGLSIVQENFRRIADIRSLPAVPESIPTHASDSGAEPPAAMSAFYFSRYEGRRGLRLAEWIAALCNSDHIAQCRRANYLRWQAAVQGFARGRALFPALPDGVVPYMFPLLLNHPLQDFYCLKRAGVPIMRWDSIAVSDCKVSMGYRLNLIQLPCHQDLGERELEWMIAAVRRVLQGNKEVQ
ncbi:MAG: DegT/DnrJ/EryC1/StrS aminotransferase family protein [Rhodocyclaceae bacterium]|nr:DegT/DnrJ/EryC1/StrS aminotransferase family protein [Rhodocyclaceae bacterium]